MCVCKNVRARALARPLEPETQPEEKEDQPLKVLAAKRQSALKPDEHIKPL